MKYKTNYSVECTAYVRNNDRILPEKFSVAGTYTNDVIAKVKLSWKLQEQARRKWKHSLVELKNMKFFYQGELFQ